MNILIIHVYYSRLNYKTKISPSDSWHTQVVSWLISGYISRTGYTPEMMILKARGGFNCLFYDYMEILR